MDDMTTKASATNQQVADDLGISHSMVSRIRSGDRKPSLALMLLIAERYGWSLDQQARAVSRGFYAAAFETALASNYD